MAGSLDRDAGDRDAGDRDAGQGDTPSLALAGFSGSLENLLVLARARQVDLGQLSLGDLIAQLVVALEQASPTIPLGRKGDWVVMAAWLVQLRSLLLLPADAPARQAAVAEADQLRARLLGLQAMRTLTTWLTHRPQLGHDVFGRGSPEVFGVTVAGMPPADVIAFLWASLAVFDDEPIVDSANLYRPRPLDLHDVAEARSRILRRLGRMPDGALLDMLLPAVPPNAERSSGSALLRRSAWSSTLLASLELARQGELVLRQADDFQPIHVALMTDAGGQPAEGGR